MRNRGVLDVLRACVSGGRSLLLFVAIVSLMVLAGWAFKAPVLTHLIPGAPAMQPLTALCFLLIAASLALQEADPARTAGVSRGRLVIGRGLAIIVGVIAVATLLEFALTIDLGFEQHIFHDELLRTGDLNHGRMAGVTAVGFVVLAGALIWLDAEPWPNCCPAEWAALAAFLLGFVGLQAYLFGLISRFEHHPLLGAAVHTVALLAALGMAVLLERPRRGLMAEFTAPFNGAVIARGMLPFAVLVPIGVGWIRVQGERADWYGTNDGLAMFAMANICVFVALVWFAARFINRAERELERSEQQFIQAQKMEAIGRLAGGVAHDFNNLLMVISGSAEHLRETLLAGDPLLSEVDDIKASAERAAALTSQLLAFSRKQVLITRLVDVNAMVQSVEKLLRRLIGEHIDLVCTLAPDLAEVRIDPHQFEQALVNLAVNARDAMPQGGTLLIQTANVELDSDQAAAYPETQAGSFVRITVTDTGRGMDDTVRRRVFEPFYTTKDVGKGTGLGLAMVYGVIRQSGGSIWVDSEPGSGTSFRIHLPIGEPNTASVPFLRQRETTGVFTETILLVEDEPEVRKFVRQALARSGYTVLEAGDGEEALRVWGERTEAIDLLITDVVMPRMGGRELADRLHTRVPSLKTIFMSGYNDDAAIVNGMLDAGKEFLAKPFSKKDLLLKVRELLDSSEINDPA